MIVTPTLLLILDGYGMAKASPSNAITLANTPHLDKIMVHAKNQTLAASGLEVGLPKGYMGNSEVGHLNIGAGRIVYQDMARIEKAIDDGEFASNPILQNLFAKLRATSGRLHIMGLLSDGGVHSHIEHTIALIFAAKEAGVPVIVHAFMDGRDTSPVSGYMFMKRLLDAMPPKPHAMLGSLVGRYYAMDRDKNWDRVAKAWNLLVHGQGLYADDPLSFIQEQYAVKITDEFLQPCLFQKPDVACIRDGDGIFMTNFRADRARELIEAFHTPDFSEFDRGVLPQLADIVCMTRYDSTFTLPVAFDKDNLTQTLGEVLSEHGIRQLRIAETEKYAHVTYFFNGGREVPFAFEDRILVPSDKSVPTYDLNPAMSVVSVTDKLLEHWATRSPDSGDIDFAVCNIANPDMVGHTGNIAATCEALEAVDIAFKRIYEAVMARHGRLIVTADHGNAECMLDEDGNPATAHTCNPVPFVIIENGQSRPLNPEALKNAKLADIAPTILACWGIEQPAAMTGTSLLV